MGLRVDGRELPEGTALFAVLFNRRREVTDVLIQTTEEDATKRGREVDAPVIIFVAGKHVSGIDSDWWIAGNCVLPDYGVPSRRIQEQMAARALKAVLAVAEKEGRAIAKGAGQA
jgi:hypothetical protein